MNFDWASCISHLCKAMVIPSTRRHSNVLRNTRGDQNMEKNRGKATYSVYPFIQLTIEGTTVQEHPDSSETTVKMNTKYNKITHSVAKWSFPCILSNTMLTHNTASMHIQLWNSRSEHVFVSCNGTAVTPCHPPTAAGTKRGIPCTFSSDGKKTWLNIPLALYAHGSFCFSSVDYSQYGLIWGLYGANRSHEGMDGPLLKVCAAESRSPNSGFPPQGDSSNCCMCPCQH